MLPIACVNHIMKFAAEMGNKKYIPIFQESGKLDWKMNSNAYANISSVMKHKLQNMPKSLQYRIVNAHGGVETNLQFQSVVLPERDNIQLIYMWNENTYIEKYYLQEEQRRSWHGNLHRPNHMEISERYKHVLYMDEEEIMIHSTPLFAPYNPDDLYDDMYLNQEDQEDQEYDENNEETFNFTTEEMEEFQNDFVFHVGETTQQ